jgi:hypothetical protein
MHGSVSDRCTRLRDDEGPAPMGPTPETSSHLAKAPWPATGDSRSPDHWWLSGCQRRRDSSLCPRPTRIATAGASRLRSGSGLVAFTVERLDGGLAVAGYACSTAFSRFRRHQWLTKKRRDGARNGASPSSMHLKRMKPCRLLGRRAVVCASVFVKRASQAKRRPSCLTVPSHVARGEPTEPHGFNFSLVGTGVSDTGAHYVFISVANGQTTFPEGEPGFPPPPDRAAGDAFTSVGRLLVIRQGSASPADDQSFFALDHITATPDGEITAIKIMFDEHCQ